MATLRMFLKCIDKSSLRNVLNRMVHVGVYRSNGCSSKISQIRYRYCAPFMCRSGTSVAGCTVAGAATPKTGERSHATRKEARQAPKTLTVGGQLTVVDEQVRRLGRVGRKQVQQLMELVTNAGSVTVKQGVKLVRCTGSCLVKETPADRIKLCEQVCQILQKSGIESNVQLYNAILQVKLQNGQTFSPVEVLNEMVVQKQLVPNRVTYHLMLSQFCELGDIEGASKILENMKAKNLRPNEAIFNSLVKGHVNKGDFCGATAVMNNMREAGIDPTADTYTALMCGIAEKGDVEGIRKVISDAHGDNVIITPRHIYDVVLTLAKKGHQQYVSSILEYIKTQNDVRYNEDAKNCMFQLIAGGFDDAAFQVNRCIDWSSYVGQEAPGRELLINMVLKERPVDVIVETWKKLHAEKLCTYTLEEVAKWALRHQHSQYAREVLEKMKSLKMEVSFVEDVKMTDNITVEELRTASVGQLESWLEKAKWTHSGQVKTLGTWLLLKYCSTGLVDKADALKSSLDSTGFVPSPYVLCQLGILAAVNKGNLQEASNYLQQLESQYPLYESYAGLIVSVAQLQMAAGKFSDAVAGLKKYSEKHEEHLQKSGIAYGYQLERPAVMLVRSCCQHNSLPQALELVDILFSCGYVKAGAYQVLDELVVGYITKSDPDGVILALEHCVSRFSKAPDFSEVFRYFIINEDAERLQKAVDLVTILHGKTNVLLWLSCNLVECGKVKEARRILETPGLHAVMPILIGCCDKFINLHKDKELEQFVDITKNLFSVDRGEMLMSLIRLHARRQDTKKILEVLPLYEEEGIFPKPSILRFVASILQSKGQPVPFDVPAQKGHRRRQITASMPEEDRKKDKKESSTQKDTPSSSNQELLQYIESADIAKLLEMRSKAPNRITFSTYVFNECVHRKKLKTSRNFLMGLATSGDVDTIMAIIDSNVPRVLRNSIHQSLFCAHVHRNSVEDILDYLKNNAADVPKYLSVAGFFDLANKRPDLMNRFEAMALDCVEQTKSHPVSSYLYLYYMKTGQFTKVKQLMQKNGTMGDTTAPSYALQQARRQQKEDILHHVIELEKSENRQCLIVPYPHLIRLLQGESNDWKSALRCYESKAVADGDLQ